MGDQLIDRSMPPGEAEQRLRQYADLLLQEGDRLGLTSLRDIDRILRELVLDSLAARAWIPESSRVVDLGSGGGCPGIPLAICRPDSRFTLVEATQRKATFLRDACLQLGLPDVEVLSVRSEELAHLPAHRESYDCVVAKALAALPTLLELALPFLRVGGSLIAYKGPSLQQEMDSAARAFHELKGKVVRVVAYSDGERSLNLCEIRKLAPSPRRYPRRPGIPNKEPLGGNQIGKGV